MASGTCRAIRNLTLPGSGLLSTPMESVNGAAGPPAIRAALAGAGSLGINVKEVEAVWHNHRDAAAWHGAKFVHALFYGRQGRSPQPSMPTRHNPPKARKNRFSGRSTMAGRAVPVRGPGAIVAAARLPCRPYAFVHSPNPEMLLSRTGSNRARSSYATPPLLAGAARSPPRVRAV